MKQHDTIVENILDTIEHRTGGEGTVTLADLVAILEKRGIAPFLVILPMIEISPIGIVPGVPTLLALVIALFAGQLAAGRRKLWLPELLGRRGVTRERLKAAVGKMRPVARWMDRHFGRRLTVLTGAAGVRLAGLVMIALCLTVPFLELVPWASSAPMLAIAFLGLAILFRDGLVMLTGFVAAALAAGAVVWWVF